MLDVDATVVARYDTNVFGNALQESDFSRTLLVGTEYKRQTGVIGMHIRGEMNFTRFRRFTDENHQNPSVTASLVHTRTKLNSSMEASFAQVTRADEAATQRLSANHYGISGRSRYRLNEKISFEGRAGFNRIDYDDDALFPDLSVLFTALDVYRRHSSKLSYFAGYRFRHSGLAFGGNSYDHSASVGTVGSILPKVMGTLRFGYQQRSFTMSEIDTRRSVTSTVNLQWTPRDRLSLSLQGSKDFDTSATAQTTDTTSADLSVQYVASQRLTLRGGAGHAWTRYLGRDGEGRRDRNLRGHAGFDYTITRFLDFSGEIHHNINRSVLPFAEFEGTRTRLSLRAHF